MELYRWIQLYLSSLKVLNKSPNTIRSYRYDLKSFYQYACQKCGSSELNTEELKNLCLDYLSALQNADESYDETSLNRKRTTLRSFVRYLARAKYITNDFSDEIKLSSPVFRSAPSILGEREISVIIQILMRRIRYAKDLNMAFMHRRNLLAFLTMLHTGIKVSELIKLKWGNLHEDTQELVVPKRKGIKVRRIPIPPKLLDEFMRFRQCLTTLEHYDDSFLNGYIFFGVNRRPTYHLNAKTIERLIDSLAHEANLTHKNITPHSLRHTMAYYSIQKNMPLSNLSRLLGHSRRSVTKQIYLQLLPSKQS